MKNSAEMTETLLKSQKEKPKRGWLRLAVLAALLASAVYLAGAGALPAPGADAPPAPAQTEAAQPVDTPAPLTPRQQREAAYEKDLAAIRQLMAQEDLREETRQQAAAQTAQMVAWHQTELGLEEALFNAGFQPCLVLVQNNALTVAVSAPELTAAQSGVILSICLAHSDVAAENIRIMPGAF